MLITDDLMSKSTQSPSKVPNGAMLLGHMEVVAYLFANCIKVYP